MKEYALYKGENILAIGTIAEIANQMGVQKGTIAYYKTQAHRNKLAKRKNSNNPSILIELADEEEEECLKTKTCTSCKRELPATREYFHVNNFNQGFYSQGFYPECKDCRNKKSREHKKSNKKEVIKESNVDFEVGKKYKVKSIDRGKVTDYFEGELIQVTKDCITLKSKLGFCESFKKVDFKIKDYSIHEVI